eukprot:1523833-Pleurochrysis_carterae.AAC.1
MAYRARNRGHGEWHLQQCRPHSRRSDHARVPMEHQRSWWAERANAWLRRESGCASFPWL